MIIFQRETRFRLRRHLVVTSLARFSILKRIELVPFLSHVCVAEMCAVDSESCVVSRVKHRDQVYALLMWLLTWRGRHDVMRGRTGDSGRATLVTLHRPSLLVRSTLRCVFCLIYTG
jgi:hypothetical protein